MSESPTNTDEENTNLEKEIDEQELRLKEYEFTMEELPEQLRPVAYILQSITELEVLK